MVRSLERELARKQTAGMDRPELALAVLDIHPLFQVNPHIA